MTKKLSLLHVIRSFCVISVLGATGWSPVVAAEEPTTDKTQEESAEQLKLSTQCENEMAQFPGEYSKEKIKTACASVRKLKRCQSHEGVSIYHLDRTGEPLPGKKSQKVLVFSVIHGDEVPSGSVSRLWMERLAEIQPRNSWRVLPILNPDGLKLKTRTNGKGVDVNRNFPTADWDELALKNWKTLGQSNARRYPGSTAASEPETVCALDHIKDFNPDFIISIHTPLGVLDFDGPAKVPFPEFKPLPWKSLGNFPGSLGRYMWKEHGVPVLTVELRGNALATKQLEAFDKLQDITGTVAIQAKKVMDQQGIEKKSPTYTGQSESAESKDKKRN